MKVLITGAAGFLGRRLTRELIARGSLTDSAGHMRKITQIILADLAQIAPPPSGDIPIEGMQGDLADPAYVARLGGFDSLFHLASQLTLQSEQNPDHGFAVNSGALHGLIMAAQGRPKLVFASSIAIFGAGLPEVVDDHVEPVPLTSYGTHKALNELIISDYSRHGRIDGRALRLPIVVTRPGAAQPAVSDRVAALLREPLEGRDIAAPFAPETLLPLASAGAVVRALIALHEQPAEALPPKRALNLPALSVRVQDLGRALARAGAKGALTYAPEPQLQAIVDGWPQRFTSRYAAELGLAPDASIEAIIEDYQMNRAS